MTDGPMSRVRRRLARSIDWRVDSAVTKAMAARQVDLLAAFAGDDPDHQDVLSRFVSLEVRNAQLDVAIERLRTLITSVSVTLTDEQRSQGELLARLAAEVDKLATEVGSLSERSNSTRG